MPKKELVDIAGAIEGETEKAYRFNDGARVGRAQVAPESAAACLRSPREAS